MFTPCSVYGAEHLLRLLYKLPELVPTANLTQEAFAMLETRVADLVAFLARHADAFFLPAQLYVLSD